MGGLVSELNMPPFMKTPPAIAAPSKSAGFTFVLLVAIFLAAQNNHAATFYAGNTEIVTGSSGLAFDGAGNLYSANPGAGTISETSPSGNASTFASGLNNPTALTFDSGGNLYVANTGDNTIAKIDSSGNASVFASGFAFDGPPELASDSSGNIYANERHVLDKFDSSGNKSTIYGPSLNFIEGMAVNTAGQLFVGLANADSILSPSGSSLNTDINNYPSPFNADVRMAAFDDGPLQLAFDANGNLFVLFGEMLESDNRTTIPDVLIEFGANGQNSVVGTEVGGTYFALEPAPEPGVLGLFALGGLLVGFRRFKARSV
jgi:DNA-binding beta-propeller fold protein YncE